MFLMLASRTIYKKVVKPIFFLFDPETVHDFVTRVGLLLGKVGSVRRLVRKILAYEDSRLEQKIWGIDFKNPVGLAAGFDKNGKLYSLMQSVGFGFSTVGTVTESPYEGNPKPRLYRLPKSAGLVVYYGLKNVGAKIITSFLLKKEKNIPQIISIGRTNSAAAATLEAGIEDYYQCLKQFLEARVGDVYEINISCPNLFCGESFVAEGSLRLLLIRLFSLPIKKPVFVKMPINLAWPEFQKLLDVILDFNIQAVVIGNLNKDRSDPNIKESIPANIKGGISGKPTWDLSNNLISATYQYCGDKLKIIGVGGIFSARDAYEKMKRGASLVELITGLIYQGPQLIGEINRDLAAFLKKDGYKNISEVIGVLNK